LSGKSRFVSNSVAVMLHTVLGAVIALVQVKVLANTLPRETFGLFASLRGLALILAIVAANGLPHLLLRFLPELEARGARARALRLCVACVLAATVTLVALVVLLRLFEARAFAFAHVGAFGPALFFWFAVYALAVTVKAVVYDGLNGLRRHTVAVVLELLSAALILALIIRQRETLEIVSLMRILGAVSGAVAAVGLGIFFGWIVGAVKGEGGGEGAPSRREYRTYLYWAGALSFVSFSFTDVDRYILAQVLALEVLALYDVAVRPIRLANRLLCRSNVAFQPEVTRWLTGDEHERVDLSTRIFFKLNGVLGVMTAVAMAVFAPDIIRVISSTDYVSAAPVLMILTVCLPLSTMTVPLTAVMKASNRIRDALLADGAWAVAYVALVFAMGIPFGITGVALAQVIACLVQLLTAIGRSTLSVDFAEAGRFCARLALVSALAYAPAVALATVPGIDPGGVTSVLLRLVLLLVGSGLVAVVLRRFGLLSKREWDGLVAALAARSPRLSRRL